MRASRILTALAGTAAVTLAAVAVAAPASGATLPEGQKITIIDADYTNEGTIGTAYNVNPASAAATPFAEAGQYILGQDVDDDGHGYAVGILEPEAEVLIPTIWAFDANTGALSNPQSLFWADGTPPDECGGLDYTNGVVLVSCVQEETELGDISTVNTVNPATGILTVALFTNGDGFQEFTALATNPVTHELWGFGPSAGDASFLIDLADESHEFVTYMDEDVFGADFDRNGQLFVSSDLYDGTEFEFPALGVADPETGIYSFLEWYVGTEFDAVLLDVQNITVWGKPALAATGSSGNELALPVGLGSALLLLAGAAFVATNRVQRRARA